MTIVGASPPPDETALLSLTEEDFNEIASVPAHGRAKFARRALVTSAVLATVSAVVLLGTSTNVSQDRINGDIVGLALMAVPSTISCYVATGGTCALDPCLASRGAQCQSGRCICSGACAGADGKCHRLGYNTPIARDFALNNIKWTHYGMYFKGTSLTGQLKTTDSPSWLNMQKDKFHLYRMAGPAGGRPKFLLGSAKWIDHVARIAPAVHNAISLKAFYATDLGKAYSPDAIALSVCYDEKEKAISLGNDAGDAWVYMTHGTWLVYAHEGKQKAAGKGALWKPDPPFTPEQHDKLPLCTDDTR